GWAEEWHRGQHPLDRLRESGVQLILDAVGALQWGTSRTVTRSPKWEGPNRVAYHGSHHGRRSASRVAAPPPWPPRTVFSPGIRNLEFQRSTKTPFPLCP